MNLGVESSLQARPAGPNFRFNPFLYAFGHLRENVYVLPSLQFHLPSGCYALRLFFQPKSLYVRNRSNGIANMIVSRIPSLSRVFSLIFMVSFIQGFP